MTQPNSLLTRIRAWLANRLDPWPDPGETWCMHCSLSNGRTIVIPVSSKELHVEQHFTAGLPADEIELRSLRTAP